METTAINGLPMRFFYSFLLGTLFLGAPDGHAQVVKCIDRTGKIVGYGSECPPGSTPEATSIRSAPRAPSSGPGPSAAEREAEFRKRQIERREAQAKTDKRASEDEARARACDNARSYLGTLQSGVRVARTDPNTGERIFLDDTQHAAEMAAAQRAAQQNCK